MNKINKFLQLASLIAKFSTVNTDKGQLTATDEIAEGVEVYIKDDTSGEFVAAPDGDYETEESIITVKDGKVEKIEAKEAPADEEAKQLDFAEQAPTDEQAEDPKDAQIKELETKITELEGLLQDRDAVIEELTAKIKELEDKAQAPVEEPVKMSATVRTQCYSEKDIPALKYFK